MTGKDQSHDRKPNLLAWIVPLGALVSSVVFPLQPLIRQALMGVMLVWIYVWFLSYMRIGP